MHEVLVVLKVWPWVMLGITFNSLLADILAKKDYTVLPMLLWTMSSVAWLVMLQSRVPLGRSMALCCVLSFVLTGLAANLLFHESLNTQQAIGYLLGLVTIGLLS